MPSSSKPKAPRRHLTLQQKVLIIDKREREGLKQDELAQWAAAEFSLPSVPTQPTISNILKDKDRLREALRLNPQRLVKSVREVTCPQFEDAVVEWIAARTADVDRRAVLEFAAQVRSQFPRAKDLALSEGWLSRLLERRGIRLRAGDCSGAEEKELEEAEDDDDTGEDAEVVAAEHEPVATETVSLVAASSSLARDMRPVPRTDRLLGPLPAVSAAKVYEQVQAHYGSYLAKTSDMRTNAASCSARQPHSFIREILKCVPEDVLSKSFGCGLAIPLGIEGLDVLDLGCGSGRDAFLLSALATPSGTVTGIDMTAPLLEVAKQNVAPFTDRLLMSRSSLHFVLGYAEFLDEAGIASESMDVVTSNFMLSLSPDKEKVLREVHRVLRLGGEFFFSDIYASRRLSPQVRAQPVVYNEGLGGAEYIDDFRALSRAIGFGEPRRVSVDPIRIDDESLAASVGSTKFYSVTFRCFKVPGIELRAREEDYGHVAKYLGTIPGHEAEYELDADYRFETRRPTRVGGNTAAILKGSWLSKHFHVDGDWSEHFGRFTQSPTVDAPFLGWVPRFGQRG